MDASTAVGLLAVLVLVLANGFFVATEFAIVAVRRSRLEQLDRDGHPGARGAKHIVDHLDAYIAACQLGITMASLALGWIGEPVLAHLIEPPLQGALGRLAPAAAHGIAVGMAFAIITALHIVAGELAPKGLALQRPEQTTLWIARPIQLFYAVFRWPITALNAVGNAALRLIGLRPAAGHEMVHSVEELELLVRASQRAGAIEDSEARIASRAFQFADLTAMQLMTPRTQLETIPASIGLDDLLARVATTGHGRLLVYDGSLDNPLGVIRARELLPLARQAPGSFDIRALLRPVLLVPESRPADDLLEDMRRAGHHLAVVVDEYGGTAGIVTLADLMRALVGRIDEESGLGPPRHAPVEPDGSMLLDGLMRVHEFEELIGADVKEPERADVATLSGLVMARLDRIPRVGDEVQVADRRLRVEQLQRHRVATIRLLPNSGSVAAETSGAA
jgi:CBS domain containing-hemolysin-like protein